MKKLQFIATITSVASAALFSGCGGGGSDAKKKVTIDCKGSDTLVQVAGIWAEKYMSANPGVSVDVAGGGSGTGIKALINGTTQICNSSREIKAEEREEIKKKTGKDVSELVVGLDALAIYTHPSNPLEEIALEQLKQIFAEGGTISNWENVGPGGLTGAISRISRASSSGTYEYFREVVCGKKADGKTFNEFKAGQSELGGSTEVVEAVANNPKAIGYSGMGYKNDKVKWLKVSKAAGTPGVAPSVAAASDGTYPLARKLYIYTIGAPEGEIKKYLDWIAGEAGQKIVEEEGFVKAPK